MLPYLGNLSCNPIYFIFFNHDLILFMTICSSNEIKFVPSVCLTACWFWTGATTALSLQSNLAGSPSAFCPQKTGALSALARRYRSVDYIYGSEKTLDTKRGAKNKGSANWARVLQWEKKNSWINLPSGLIYSKFAHFTWSNHLDFCVL